MYEHSTSGNTHGRVMRSNGIIVPTTPNTKQVRTKDLYAYMLKMGFHRHKQSHRSKGLYYSVGGYDVTKADAEHMYRQTQQLLTDTVNKVLDEVEVFMDNCGNNRGDLTAQELFNETSSAIEQVRSRWAANTSNRGSEE